MTLDTLKEVVKLAGGEQNIIAMYFDNDRVVYCPNGEFSLNNAKMLGGELVYMHPSNILSKGVKGGHLDVPVVSYNAGLQSVVALKDVADRERTDFANFYLH